MCRLFVRSDAEAAEILHHVVDLLLLHDLGLLLLPLHLLRHRSIDHLKKIGNSIEDHTINFISNRAPDSD